MVFEMLGWEEGDYEYTLSTLGYLMTMLELEELICISFGGM